VSPPAGRWRAAERALRQLPAGRGDTAWSGWSSAISGPGGFSETPRWRGSELRWLAAWLFVAQLAADA
jgi:hypothetical protein